MNLSRVRIFGSRVVARQPGRRPTKLDLHCDTGVFVGYGAADANANFIDDSSCTVKLGTHIIFDEAHISVPASKAPLAAEALQRLGYRASEEWTLDPINILDSSSLEATNRICFTPSQNHRHFCNE